MANSAAKSSKTEELDEKPVNTLAKRFVGLEDNIW